MDPIEMTPMTREEVLAFIEKRKREMTAAELMKYIDDDEPTIPAERVLEQIREAFPEHFRNGELSR